MGDRANVFIPDPQTQVEDGKGVYLYTHWGGTSLPVLVQRVLGQKKRWDDKPYLVRMIFSEMIKNDISGESGYGIDTRIGDNEHNLVVVDADNQRVCISDDDQWISFEKFITMNNSEIYELYGEP